MPEENVVEVAKSEYSVAKTFKKAGLDIAIAVGLAVGDYLMGTGVLDALFKAVPAQYSVPAIFLVRAVLTASLNYLKNRGK